MKITNVAACSYGSGPRVTIDQTMDAFAVDEDTGDILQFHCANELWTTTVHPNPFGSSRLTRTIAACAQSTQRVDLFGIDTDGVLQHLFGVANGPAALSWQTEKLGKIGITGGLTACWSNSPDSALPPRMDVFVLLADGKLLVQMTYSTSGGAGSWSLPQGIDYTQTGIVGYFTGDLTCCSRGGGLIDIFGWSNAGLLRLSYLAGWHGSIVPTNGRYQANTRIVAVSRSSWELDLFGLDDSRTTSRFHFVDGQWNFQLYYGASQPEQLAWVLCSGCARSSERVSFFWVSPLGQIIHEAWWGFLQTPLSLTETIYSPTTVEIPIPGNAFVTAGPATVVIDDMHLEAGRISDWTDSTTVISVYFWVDAPTTVFLGVKGGGGSATNATQFTLTENRLFMFAGTAPIKATSYDDVQRSRGELGHFRVELQSYVRIDMSGSYRTGATYGSVAALLVRTDPPTKIGCVDHRTIPPGSWQDPDPASRETPYYMYGRRGATPNLAFDASGSAEDEYFYAELTVREIYDPPEAYYMVTGFNAGYAGIQRLAMPNKYGHERILLFSVWDNAKVAPIARAQVIAKAPEVTVERFGNEGAGGKTWLPFDWSPGKTYRFVLRGRPDGADTLFTAWYSAGATWQPIATIRYPQRAAYLGGLHHFLENFDPRNGCMTREARFGNQWVRNHAGVWRQLTRAVLGGDFMAAQGQRRDFMARVSTGENQMILTAGGFFTGTVPLQSSVLRADSPDVPPVDVATDLPEPPAYTPPPP